MPRVLTLPQCLATAVRVITGLSLLWHGWHKLFEAGIAKEAQLFETWQVPMPRLSAWIAGLGEFFGGIALLVGIFTTLVSVLMMAIMVGAIFTVHIDNGFSFANPGVGWEVPLIYIAILLSLTCLDYGPLSLDAQIAKRLANRKLPATILGE